MEEFGLGDVLVAVFEPYPRIVAHRVHKGRGRHRTKMRTPKPMSQLDGSLSIHQQKPYQPHLSPRGELCTLRRRHESIALVEQQCRYQMP